MAAGSLPLRAVVMLLLADPKLEKAFTLACVWKMGTAPRSHIAPHYITETPARQSEWWTWMQSLQDVACMNQCCWCGVIFKHAVWAKEHAAQTALSRRCDARDRYQHAVRILDSLQRYIRRCKRTLMIWNLSETTSLDKRNGKVRFPGFCRLMRASGVGHNPTFPSGTTYRQMARGGHATSTTTSTRMDYGSDSLLAAARRHFAPSLAVFATYEVYSLEPTGGEHVGFAGPGSKR